MSPRMLDVFAQALLDDGAAIRAWAKTIKPRLIDELRVEAVRRCRGEPPQRTWPEAAAQAAVDLRGTALGNVSAARLRQLAMHYQRRAGVPAWFLSRAPRPPARRERVIGLLSRESGARKRPRFAPLFAPARWHPAAAMRDKSPSARKRRPASPHSKLLTFEQLRAEYRPTGRIGARSDQARGAADRALSRLAPDLDSPRGVRAPDRRLNEDALSAPATQVRPARFTAREPRFDPPGSQPRRSSDVPPTFSHSPFPRS